MFFQGGCQIFFCSWEHYVLKVEFIVENIFFSIFMRVGQFSEKNIEILKKNYHTKENNIFDLGLFFPCEK